MGKLATSGLWGFALEEPIGEQLAQLRGIRALLEEARYQVENLPRPRAQRIVILLRGALREVDAQIRELEP